MIHHTPPYPHSLYQPAYQNMTQDKQEERVKYITSENNCSVKKHSQMDLVIGSLLLLIDQK